METIKAELVHRPEEGFDADEADSSRDPAQIIRAPGILVRLDRDADPDMWRPRQRLTEPGEALGPLGEDLVGVPIGPEHHVEDVPDELNRDGLAELIRHGVDEAPARFSHRCEAEEAKILETPQGQGYKVTRGEREAGR
jgi:hypothetical protein